MKNIENKNQSLKQFDVQRTHIFYPKAERQIAELVQKESSNTDHDISELMIEVILQQNGMGRALKVIPFTTLGTLHIAYQVILENKKNVVVRLNRFMTLRSSYEFFIEDCVYNKLAVYELQHVQIHATDCEQCFSDFDYQIMEYVAGKTIRQLEHPETQALDEKLLEIIGSKLASFHTVPVQGYGLLSASAAKHNKLQGLHKTWSDYLFCQLDEHIQTCLELEAVSEQEAEKIKMFFTENKNIFDKQQSVLLHGDPGGHNVICREEQSLTFIDWEDSLGGDWVYDIAFWGTFYKDWMLEPMLRGYVKQSGCKIPSDFYRRYWLYYLRVALAKTVHRHLFGYQDVPGRQPLSQRIQKALEKLSQNFDISSKSSKCRCSSPMM